MYKYDKISCSLIVDIYLYLYIIVAMLLKVNSILLFGLVTFVLSTILYPWYIRFLKKIKAWKTIREDDVSGQKSTIFASLHGHKAGTPTMGGGFFLIMVLIMVVLSFIPQQLWWINNTLISRQETYILLFGFFSMGIIGLIDDILNIRWYGRVKWLNAWSKMLGMTLFAGFISYWFYVPLGVDWITLRPGMKIVIGRWFVPLTFIFTLFVTHAINITDWLDGLAAGMMSMILATLSVVTFLNSTYIATSLIVIVVAVLFSFLWYNINPAKIFMWDSGAFALGGLLSSLILLLNMKEGIIIPFIILFALFIVELLSSFLQMGSKKFLNKKIFPIAPLHHLFEYHGMKEYTVVMRFWMIQGLLAIIAIVVILYIDILL